MALPGWVTLALVALANAESPHILVVVVDDWGYANVGFRNPLAAAAGELVTPNIDALAASGLVLNRMYAHPFCAPSRCSLLSGRLPLHGTPPLLLTVPP